MYLPDTNVFILAAEAKEPDKRFLEKAIAKKQIYLSVIAIGEFLSQASDEAETKFNALIARFPILTVDLETAKLAAEYRNLSFKTKRVHLLDCFLAAQAKLNNLTLVTNNKSDFPMKDIKVITP